MSKRTTPQSAPFPSLPRRFLRRLPFVVLVLLLLSLLSVLLALRFLSGRSFSFPLGPLPAVFSCSSAVFETPSRLAVRGSVLTLGDAGRIEAPEALLSLSPAVAGMRLDGLAMHGVEAVLDPARLVAAFARRPSSPSPPSRTAPPPSSPPPSAPSAPRTSFSLPGEIGSLDVDGRIRLRFRSGELSGRFSLHSAEVGPLARPAFSFTFRPDAGGILTLSRLRWNESGLASFALSASGLDMKSLSSFAADLFPAFPLFDEGVASFTVRADSLNPPRITVLASLSSAVAFPGSWRVGRADISLGATFVLDGEGTPSFPTVSIRERSSRLSLSCTARWEKQGLTVGAVRLDIGDLAALSRILSLRNRVGDLAGSLSCSGAGRIAFASPCVVFKGSLNGKSVRLERPDVPLVLYPASLQGNCSLVWTPVSWNMDLQDLRLATRSISTRWFAWLCEEHPLSLDAKVEYALGNLDASWKAASDAYETTGSLRSRPRRLDLSLSLRSSSPALLPAVFYNPTLAAQAERYSVGEGSLSLDASLTHRPGGPLAGSLSAELPALRFRAANLEDGFSSASVQARFRVEEDRFSLSVERAELKDLAGFPLTTLSGVLSGSGGAFRGRLTSLEGPLRGGRGSFSLAPGEPPQASLSFSSLPVSPALAAARRYFPDIPAAFSLSGAIEDGLLTLRHGRLSLSARAAGLNASASGLSVSGLRSALALSLSLDEPHLVSLSLSAPSADSLSLPDNGALSALSSDSLSFLLDARGAAPLLSASGLVRFASWQAPDGLVRRGSLRFRASAALAPAPSLRALTASLSADALLSGDSLIRGASLSADLLPDGSWAVKGRADSLSSPSWSVLRPAAEGTLVPSEHGLRFSGLVTVDGASLSDLAASLPRASLTISTLTVAPDGSLSLEPSALSWPFGAGTLSLAASGDSFSSRIELAVEDLSAFTASFPLLSDGGRNAFSGSASLSADLSSGPGGLSLSLSASLALDGWSLPGLHGSEGENLSASLDASLSFPPGRSDVLFSLRCRLRPGDLMVGDYFFSLSDELYLRAGGVLDPSSGDGSLSSFSLSFPLLFASLRGGATFSRWSPVSVEAAVSALDLRKTTDFFYTSQLAPGDEPLFSAEGIFDLKAAWKADPGAPPVLSLSLSGKDAAFELSPSSPSSLVAVFDGDAAASLRVEATPDGGSRCSLSFSAPSLFLSCGPASASLAPLSLSASIALTAAGGFSLSGRLGTGGSLSVEGASPGSFLLSVEGMRLDFPFSLASSAAFDTPEAPPGSLAFSSLSLAGLKARSLRLPLRLSRNRLELPSGLVLEGEGGALSIGAFLVRDVLNPAAGGGALVETSSLRVRPVLDALGLPPFDGLLSLSWRASVGEDGLRLSGSARLQAFGGLLTLEDPFFAPGRYPSFGFAELLVENIDLFALTSSFEGYAASVSGNLCGYVRDFVWAYGEPQRFRLWLHTVPMKGRRQIITAGVVNIIALNSPEVRSAMKLFNLTRFPYAYIRLGARLENGVILVSNLPDGAPGGRDNILLKGKRAGFFRLILRVAGSVRGDWRSVWGSVKEAVNSLGSGASLEIVH